MDSASPGGVSEFDVASDGFLAPKGATAAAGAGTQDMAVPPNGASAYAVAAGNSVYQFSIDSAGRLNSLGSPLTAGTHMAGGGGGPGGPSPFTGERAGAPGGPDNLGRGGGPLAPGPPPGPRGAGARWGAPHPPRG